MMQVAANDSKFEPLVLADPAFMAWAVRVGLRLRNKQPGSPDSSIERAFLMEGIPSPEWANGLAYVIRLAQSNKREAASA